MGEGSFTVNPFFMSSKNPHADSSLRLFSTFYSVCTTLFFISRIIVSFILFLTRFEVAN